jgi:pseudaminic acid biosynthesis-associated methylase
MATAKKAVKDSPQVAFWRGEFGDAYIERSTAGPANLRLLVAHWARILDCMAGSPPRSILEVGSNVGNNLHALRALTDAELFAVEPNRKAREKLVRDGVVPAANVRDGVAASIDLPAGAVDLAFTSGVLIHVHPDELAASCREIHRVSARYIVCNEYFSDKPEAILYRGNAEHLFKRDFGAFWLDGFPGLRLLGYGFAWRRATGLDNLTWWAFEKRP